MAKNLKTADKSKYSISPETARKLANAPYMHSHYGYFITAYEALNLNDLEVTEDTLRNLKNIAEIFKKDFNNF